MKQTHIFQLQRTSGHGRGKKMGLPTLNFIIPTDFPFRQGIYAGWVIVHGKKYQAAIHYGPRPVFHETDPSLEAYILEGLISDAPNKLTMQIVDFVREVRLFPNPQDMLKQIEKDVAQIKHILQKNSL